MAAWGGPRQALPGHLPPGVAGKPSLRTAAAPPELDLAFALPLRHRESLTNLLQDLYDPGSPNFHQYLTPEQFADRFGPTDADYEAVVQFAQTNHLRVVTRHGNRAVLVVHGAVSDIERALHVKMGVYPHPTEARTFYAPDSEPAVDLDTPLAGIWGLHNYFVARPGGGVIATNGGDYVSPGGGSGTYGYRGDDLRPAYVPGTTLTGAGQVIGLFELDGYYNNDIVAYENSSSISPLVPLSNVLVDGFSGTPGTNANSVGEVSLDIEVALAMAPGVSKVMVYEAQNNGAHILSLLTRIATDNQAKQISSSWFIFNEPGGDAVYQQMAAQGQSFFQCSGDLNAFYSGIGQWADNPYITICGGTFLNTTGPRGSWVSETVWNNGNGTNGSGGGISLNYSIPLWQQGVSMASNQGSTSMRNVPDVSMLAYGAQVNYFNGAVGGFWGTSIAAPMWAGFMALVNQQSVAGGYGTIGFANPALYSLGKGAAYGAVFHDVISGANTNRVSTTKYFAAAGYDLCTGWGTPSGTNLINALVNYAGGVWVAFGLSDPGDGSYVRPYNTMARGVSGVTSGGNVLIKAPGSSPETMTITKPMTIRSVGGSSTVGR